VSSTNVNQRRGWGRIAFATGIAATLLFSSAACTGADSSGSSAGGGGALEDGFGSQAKNRDV
jgi:hypothetical protein